MWDKQHVRGRGLGKTSLSQLPTHAAAFEGCAAAAVSPMYYVSLYLCLEIKGKRGIFLLNFLPLLSLSLSDIFREIGAQTIYSITLFQFYTT